MIKMQHPEYEMFTADSTHYKAGVACADCHMPYTRDGAAKYSTHDVQSPLLNAETACGACHTDVEYVVGRVTRSKTRSARPWIAAKTPWWHAINAIKAAAATPNADGELLSEAATCTVRRSSVGISSQLKTAWASTTLKKHCASWLPQLIWRARPS